MNLLKECNENEIKLLQDIGIVLEDKEYSNEELRRYEISIEEFIMSHSSKNDDIRRVSNQYNSVLNKIVQ